MGAEVRSEGQDARAGETPSKELAEAVAAEVARLPGQLGPWLQRMVSEELDRRSNSGAGPAQGQVEALTARLKELERTLAEKQHEARLRAAVSKVNWFDMEDAVRELLPRVKETGGRLFVEGAETVAGVETVRAELRGGTGAGQAGAPGPGGLHALGYEELMTLAQRDPAEFRKYLLGNREEWTAKKRAFFAGRK